MSAGHAGAMIREEVGSRTKQFWGGGGGGVAADSVGNQR